jgi:ribosomal protein S16
MGDVFVLTTTVGNEQRPVAVVTSEHAADQWVQSGNDNDWIPFAVDDLSLTGMADKSVTPFKPKPMPKIDDVQKMRRDTIESLKESNAQLQKTVEQLIEKIQQLQTKKRGSFENPLLQKEIE